MSTKKGARAQRAADELKEKAMNTARHVGLMGALLAALSGPLPAVPIEDPRRPRDAAAWHPTPDAKKRRAKGKGKDEPEPERTVSKPVVYLTEGVTAGPNKYLREVGEGKNRVIEFGNRLKDRRRKLEQLLTMVGVKPTPRQVKRCQKGLFPAPLIRWLIAYKEWRDQMLAKAAPTEAPAPDSNAALADQLAATVAAAQAEVTVEKGQAVGKTEVSA